MVQSHSDIPFRYLPYSGGMAACAKHRILVWGLTASKENHQYFSTGNFTFLYTMTKVNLASYNIFSTDRKWTNNKSSLKWGRNIKYKTVTLNLPDNYTSQKTLVVTFWDFAEDSGDKELQN